MKTLLFTAVLFCAGTCRAQTTDTRTGLLIRKIQAVLNNLSAVGYRQTKQIHYAEDHYDSKMVSDLYFDFSASSPIGLRFRAEETKSVFVYNGKSTYRIDKENLTIDTGSAPTARSMASNSYLSNSLATLRNILAAVMANDSIVRSSGDTVIDNRRWLSVKFEGPQMYFSSLGELERFSLKGLLRPYYLLVDPLTLMPYRLVTKFIRGQDDRDFMSSTYESIDLHPARPSEDTWTYASYLAAYHPYVKPAPIPLVKAGTALGDFRLPVYTPSGADSISFSRYAGKVVLVDFWFKSCAPCMEAMPKYNALQQAFGKDRFQLLTVNVEDPVSDVQYFYEKYRPVYPMLYAGNKLWTGLGFTGCPTAVLVDQKGIITEVFYGFNEDTLKPKIEALIARH